MPRLSPEEQQQLEALQARANEPDEDPEEDFEVVMQDADGHTVHLPYSKAKTVLKKWGFDLDEITPQEGENPGEGEPPEGEEEPPTPKRGGYWGKK